MIPFKPVIEKGEDAFLPASPTELLRNYSAVPWMTGINSEEGALFASSEKQFRTHHCYASMLSVLRSQPNLSHSGR
jgi:carboxylesterase type B